MTMSSGKYEVDMSRLDDELSIFPKNNEILEEAANDNSKAPFKTDKNKQESKVIHIGYICPSASEIEIFAIAAPFGIFINFLYMKSKNQALVEFARIDSAIQMVNYSNDHPIKIRNKKVSVRFSTHQSLNVTQTRTNFARVYESFENHRSCPVLHASIHEYTHLCFEDFEQLFWEFGEIRKMILFKKNKYLQVLVEMGTIESAMMAKIALDGSNRFGDHSVLKVEYSDTHVLNIKRPGNQCRDYTTISSSEDFYRKKAKTFGRNSAPYFRDSSSASDRSFEHSFRDQSSHDSKRSRVRSPVPFSRSVILMSNLPTNLSCDDLFNFVGYYGDIKKIKILFNKPQTCLIEMVDDYSAEQVIKNLHQVEFGDKKLHVVHSNYKSISIPASNSSDADLFRDYSDSRQGRYRIPRSKNTRHIYPPSNILHVSNVNPEMSLKEISDLFTIIACVNVERVEKLRNIEHQAFVIMKTITDAIIGIMKLHNYALPPSSNILKVSFSKGSIEKKSENVN